MHEHIYKTIAVSVGCVWTACACGKLALERLQARRGTVWRAGLGERVVECSGTIEEAR